MRLVSVLLAVLALGCASDPCAGIAARLASASPGETVSIAGCRTTEALVVPAGVALEGGGTAQVAPEQGVAIEVLTENGSTTTVRGVEVLGHGAAAIAIRGVGSASIADVSVEAHGGVAIGTGGATVSIADCTLGGEVREADRDDTRWLRVIGAAPPGAACPTDACECDPGAVDGTRACDTDGRWATLTATHGIYARGGAITIERTTVTGFALAAIVLEDATSTLREVHAGEGLGVGIEAIGGSLDAESTEVIAVWDGLRGSPSYAALFASGADVVTRALAVRDADGYGVVHASSDGAHTGLVVERTGDVAVWSGGGDRLEIAGSARIEDAAFAGVLAVDVAEVHLADLEIASTRSVRRVVGVRGAIDVGDGAHLVGSGPVLERVSIAGAERAGLVVDLATTPSFAEVTVEGAGTALGAVAGSVDRGTGVLTPGAAGWDVGITRTGTAAANDAAFAGSLDAVVSAEPPSAGPIYGAIGPMY